MATITIRDLDDATKAKLRIRAAKHGRSMEAEVREILTHAVEELQYGLGSRINARFKAIHELYPDEPFELEPLPRGGKMREVDFGE